MEYWTQSASWAAHDRFHDPGCPLRPLWGGGRPPRGGCSASSSRAGSDSRRCASGAINPGEASIRRGLLDALWPATFPSGQGSDLAGVVAEIGEGVNGVAVGDEVIGWSDERSSQAEAVSLPAEHVVPKPSGVSWEPAGSLYVAGTTAWATVKSVGLESGQVVAVSGAAGGVGSIAIQLARRSGPPCWVSPELRTPNGWSRWA